ncbi:MAG: hypothetical protein HC922_04430 [Leptolyngbyaceae cyanobacterium SM2_3_12]|nr:hypothetical protein [Leptolyngbyaceae cyanobacterium SM2_3_12]
MANPVRFSRPLAGFCAVVGVLAVAPTVLAQATGSDPTSVPVVDTNTGFSSPEGGGNIFNDASGPMDLIHRAVLMNEMSLSDFSRQQQGRLSTEAANFRTLQQEAIRQQSAAEAAATDESAPEVQ